MMPIPLEYQKTVLYTSIILTAFIAAFALQALLPSTFAAASEALRGSVAQADGGTVYLDPSAAPAEGAAAQIPAQLNVAENGFIHIGGARVSSVQNGLITARLSWSSAQLTWKIDASSAKFYGKNGEAVDADSIKTGDVLSVSGSLSGGSQIDAQYIRLQR
ncbi:MAG TPA: hypothetical protein VHD38_00245 [Candidatus Paceibacterota bacterium]|nr:hypothetical protein [Candidatus Paceibacterota bacterium]